jgi:hypothetical protein
MIATVQIERFSLTSSRPFDEILAAIKAAVGHPDMVEKLLRAQQSAPLASNMLGSASLTIRSIWGVGCFTAPVQVKPAAVQVESSSLAAETRRDKRP